MSRAKSSETIAIEKLSAFFLPVLSGGMCKSSIFTIWKFQEQQRGAIPWWRCLSHGAVCSLKVPQDSKRAVLSREEEALGVPGGDGMGTCGRTSLWLCPTPRLSGGLGLGRTFCCTVRIEILGSVGKEKHGSEGSQGFAEIKVSSIPITLLVFAILCCCCVLWKLGFPALDLLREHKRKMKRSNVFALLSSRCQLSLSGTISHFMTRLPYLSEFCSPLSVLGWIFKRVFVGSLRLEGMLFIKLVPFWASKARLCSAFHQLALRAPRAEWALSLLTQLVGSQCEWDSGCVQVCWNAVIEQ